MALTDPLQLLAIAAVVIIVLLWGPKKIPELARSIGLARKEFNDASKAPLDSAAAGNAASTTAAPAASASSTGDALLDTARKLGINTEGKTRDQISSEIVARAQTS